MLGTVANFTPYRLTVMRRNGNVQTVDLKNGTVIRPNGSDAVARASTWRWSATIATARSSLTASYCGPNE